MTLPICERLRAVESGASDFIGDRAPLCATCWHRNPDGPEAADTIEALVDALEFARAEIEVLNKGDSPSIRMIDAALSCARGEPPQATVDEEGGR